VSSAATPDPRLSLAEDAYQTLARRIVEGELEPGRKLDIFEIAAELRVSRTPVKEAFNRLALEGMLTIHPRRGTFVSRVTADDVREVFDVRLMMEAWAVRRLAESKDAAVIEEMERQVRACEEVMAERKLDYEIFVSADLAFHRAIVEGGANARLERFYASVFPHVQLMRIYRGRAREQAERSHRHHVEILRAVRDAGPNYAVDALTAHITSSRDDVLRKLASDNRPIELPHKSS
jgi:DNA-binding GntR family transcriptional regulator